MEGGGGGIETVWELHTVNVAATKECRKLNNPGGIMVVMKPLLHWKLVTHMLRQSREQKFTDSFLQEHL